MKNNNNNKREGSHSGHTETPRDRNLRAIAFR